MSKFICSNCGYIGKNFNENTGALDNCVCGKKIEVKEFYPSFDALNFISTAHELYKSCKDIDKQNKTSICKILKQIHNIDLTKSDLTNYITKYESILSKYQDSNPELHLKAINEFEKYILKKIKFGVELQNILSMYWKNRMRKPFVIMVSSSIELLFNDFFKLLLVNKIGEKGSNIILDKYKYAGIQECISICDAFTSSPLKKQIELIKPSFFDSWETLRRDRNIILHSNSKYITVHRVENIKKLLYESEDVFSKLKSNVYKKNI